LTDEAAITRFGRAVWVLLWGAVIVVPLAGVVGIMVRPVEGIDTLRIVGLAGRTFGLSGVIAGIAVLLGFLPGRLLGGGGRGRFVVLLAVLLPLVLPRYVLYYSWTLLFNPATELGRVLASRGELGRFVWGAISTGVLVSWYWPVASLIIGQGYRNLDRRIFDSAALEAGAFDVFRKVTLPLLRGPLVLAFGVCFVMSLSEFTTFHLAGVQTIGTELAVMYEMTGTERYPAVIAAPVFVAALAIVSQAAVTSS
jgi:ABC-type Fe3+ transport system permease subunit